MGAEFAQLARWAGAALAPIRRSMVLSVRVVGEARSPQPGTAHFRRKGQADQMCLSFAARAAFLTAGCFLGELVICAPVVVERR